MRRCIEMYTHSNHSPTHTAPNTAPLTFCWIFSLVWECVGFILHVFCVCASACVRDRWGLSSYRFLFSQHRAASESLMGTRARAESWHTPVLERQCESTGIFVDTCAHLFWHFTLISIQVNDNEYNRTHKKNKHMSAWLTTETMLNLTCMFGLAHVCSDIEREEFMNYTAWWPRTILVLSANWMFMWFYLDTYI